MILKIDTATDAVSEFGDFETSRSQYADAIRGLDGRVYGLPRDARYLLAVGPAVRVPTLPAPAPTPLPSPAPTPGPTAAPTSAPTAAQAAKMQPTSSYFSFMRSCNRYEL